MTLAEVLESAFQKYYRYMCVRHQRAAGIHKIAPKGPKSGKFQGELQRPSDVSHVG